MTSDPAVTEATERLILVAEETENAHTLPLLRVDDFTAACQVLPRTPWQRVLSVLCDCAQEIAMAEAHELSDDHNADDPAEAGKHRACAESLARDAVLQDRKATA